MILAQVHAEPLLRRRTHHSVAQRGALRSLEGSCQHACGVDLRHRQGRISKDQELPRRAVLDMGHPWIFENEIRNISELNLAAGTVVPWKP